MNPSHYAADCTLCQGEGDLPSLASGRLELITCPRCGGRGTEPQGLPPVSTTLSTPGAR